jgi:cytochrome P450
LERGAGIQTKFSRFCWRPSILRRAGIGEAEVKSNILTFIMAGHETTANLLSGSLFLLSQADLWRQRLHLEAEREINGSVADLADHLPVTRAVIEEAARLYPPIAAISRVALVQSWLARRSPRGCWL